MRKRERGVREEEQGERGEKGWGKEEKKKRKKVREEREGSKENSILRTYFFSCFLNSDMNFTWTFMVPVLVILLTNVVGRLHHYAGTRRGKQART